MIMQNIKRGDFVKSVAKATGLSAERAKKVVVAAGKEVKKKGVGFDLGYTNQTLSKKQEKEAINAISGVIKKMGFKYVVGLKNERGFRKKLTDNDTQFKQSPDKTPKNTAKTEIIKQIREQSAPKAAFPAKTFENPLPQAPVKSIPMADKSSAIEAVVAHTQPSEPIAPDIG